jgi:hypothetical protein
MSCDSFATLQRRVCCHGSDGHYSMMMPAPVRQVFGVDGHGTVQVKTTRHALNARFRCKR